MKVPNFLPQLTLWYSGFKSEQHIGYLKHASFWLRHFTNPSHNFTGGGVKKCKMWPKFDFWGAVVLKWSNMFKIWKLRWEHQNSFRLFTHPSPKFTGSNKCQSLSQFSTPVDPYFLHKFDVGRSSPTLRIRHYKIPLLPINRLQKYVESLVPHQKHTRGWVVGGTRNSDFANLSPNFLGAKKYKSLLCFSTSFNFKVLWLWNKAT